MAKPIISVSDLEKQYKVFKRGESFKEVLKSVVVRKYETVDALKGISFDVDKGEIIGLIGPNGAGKSTAIKIMTGVLYPDSGKVKVMDYEPWSDREEYVKYIGVVFGQKTQLWWDIPPIDSYYLMKDLYEIPQIGFDRRLKKMIKLLEVEEAYKTPTRNLSLGQRTKCDIISSVLHQPKIVFLDEPTIGMDIIAKDRIREFIKKQNKKYNTTFVITSHDMTDIEKLCKRIIIINKGIVVYDGLLEDLKKRYIKKKVIDVKFFERTSVKIPRWCNKILKSKYEIKVEVPRKDRKVDEVIKYLLDNYNVADITISDPEIDDIIKEIFSK